MNERFFHEAFLQRAHLEIIGVGTYHKNYKFKFLSQNYVLRVPMKREQFDFRSIPEWETLKLLQKLNFKAAPVPVYLSNDPAFIILDYFDGEPISEDFDFSEPVSILEGLHKLIVPKDWTYRNSRSLAFRLRAFGSIQMLKYSKQLDVFRNGLSAELIKEVRSIPIPRDRVSCLLHGDPARSNFLLDSNRNIRLIDFELAMMGDPMLDYALVLNRCFVANPRALKFILHENKHCINSQFKVDLLGYALSDVARSIHVVAAKFLDSLSPLYDLRRGEGRLNKLLVHRTMLKQALNAL